jgi:hypothetical protein
MNTKMTKQKIIEVLGGVKEFWEMPGMAGSCLGS